MPESLEYVLEYTLQAREDVREIVCGIEASGRDWRIGFC